MRARNYWLASGALLGALAIAGALARASGLGRAPPWFVLEPEQDALHAALAIASIAIGLAPIPDKRQRRLALGAATFYLALAALGSLAPRLFGYPARMGLTLRFEVMENAAHLMLGVWSAYVGTRET